MFRRIFTSSLPRTNAGLKNPQEDMPSMPTCVLCSWQSPKASPEQKDATSILEQSRNCKATQNHNQGILSQGCLVKIITSAIIHNPPRASHDAKVASSRFTTKHPGQPSLREIHGSQTLVRCGIFGKTTTNERHDIT